MRLHPLLEDARTATMQVKHGRVGSVVPGRMLKRSGEASYVLVLAVLDIRHAAYENGDRVFQVSCLIHYVGLHDRWQPQGTVRIFIGGRLEPRWSMMC